MRCRWRRRAEENTGGRERRKREVQSGCGGKAAEGKTGGKRKHRRNERKIKSKAGNQTVSLFLLSGNYTSIKAQLKEKTHQAYQVSDRLKQGFLFSFIIFLFILWAQHTTWGQHRSTRLSPLWQRDATFMLHAVHHLQSRRSERSVMNIRKSTSRNPNNRNHEELRARTRGNNSTDIIITS